MRIAALPVLCLLLHALPLRAQIGGPPPAAPAPAAAVTPPTKTETLRALLAARDGIRAALDDQRKKLATEASESIKRDLQQQIETLEMRRQEVERDFATIATGLQSTPGGTASGSTTPPTLQDEIGQLLTPIFSDLRQLTKKTRAVQELQDEHVRLKDRENQAARALAELDRQLAELKAAKGPDAALRTALNDTRKTWQTRQDEARSRIAAIQHQLAELKTSGLDFWTELGANVKHFVFIRGTNILLALLVFLVVFFGLRTAYSYLVKALSVRKYQRLSFTVRVADVLHQAVSLVAAIAAALLVLYARGDWLLGGISLLALGGLLVTAKTGIARHLEQLQFLLNLGPVREGERVVIGGVPWRVGAIGMFTQLTNPSIPGASLRLPLESLATLTSRPDKLGEAWFPCENRAWIALNNGTLLAQVTDITPDRVELTLPGGMRRSMTMAAFFAADVVDLSPGFYRSTTFIIDSSHQARATAEIPGQMKADLRESLLKIMREDELRDLSVEIEQASSLYIDYHISATFAGSQAPNFLSLPRVLKRAAFEASLRHGWSSRAEE
ncbi:MAG: hypothetical protein JNG86_13705 [Verrucomicrobiaceae bacterium]|nr:hypothetical protein [Verrucomicrobiaceae bacterium]